MTYSEFIKTAKENNLKRFFGEVKHISNKYFTFKRVIDNDNCIVITNNIKVIKGNLVLVVDNNKVVYLKDWQVAAVHNYDSGLEAYAVKLNRNFFKPYTFNFNFEDMSFEKEETFEDMMSLAKEQENKNLSFALGHMN